MFTVRVAAYAFRPLEERVTQPVVLVVVVVVTECEREEAVKMIGGALWLRTGSSYGLK